MLLDLDIEVYINLCLAMINFIVSNINKNEIFIKMKHRDIHQSNGAMVWRRRKNSLSAYIDSGGFYRVHDDIKFEKMLSEYTGANIVLQLTMVQ